MSMKKNCRLFFAMTVLVLLLLYAFWAVARNTETFPAQTEPLHDLPSVDKGEIEDRTAAEEKTEGDMLLADRHEEYGIECNECHLEDPPENEVPTAGCIGCHEDFRRIFRSAQIDPHNSHLNIDDCGSCHHAHKPSDVPCAACHDYDF